MLYLHIICYTGKKNHDARLNRARCNNGRNQTSRQNAIQLWIESSPLIDKLEYNQRTVSRNKEQVAMAIMVIVNPKNKS